MTDIVSTRLLLTGADNPYSYGIDDGFQGLAPVMRRHYQGDDLDEYNRGYQEGLNQRLSQKREDSDNSFPILPVL